jgi:hypothetical protein
MIQEPTKGLRGSIKSMMTNRRCKTPLRPKGKLRVPPTLNLYSGRRSHIFNVSCDMKLHSVLLGGAILTKPCVCPQVPHGSMRLAGGPEVGATVRGMKPSR